MRGDKPRRLVVCTLAVAPCHLIADAALDPAWSSDGARVAFVHADEHPPADSSDWPAEYARRALVVAAADGSDPRNVPDSEGAASPTWLDDHRILFVHDGGLWVLDRTTGRLSELVHAIGRPGAVPPPEPYEATDLTGYAWTNSFDVRGG
jgi:hypothetical protein